MKLVTKLTVAFMIVTCLFLAINGVHRYRKEVRAFHEDLVLDHKRLAHAFAQAASAVRKTDGPEASHRFIDEANARDGSRRLHGGSIQQLIAEESPRTTCSSNTSERVDNV